MLSTAHRWPRTRPARSGYTSARPLSLSLLPPIATPQIIVVVVACIISFFPARGVSWCAHGHAKRNGQVSLLCFKPLHNRLDLFQACSPRPSVPRCCFHSQANPNMDAFNAGTVIDAPLVAAGDLAGAADEGKIGMPSPVADAEDFSNPPSPDEEESKNENAQEMEDVAAADDAPQKPKKIKKSEVPSSPKKTAKAVSVGPKRHRNVLRENIQGITKPAIRRLARRGGCKRISGLVYEETRGVLKVFLETVIRDAVTYTAHARRKTVTAMDVVYALKRQGRTLYGYGG